MKRRIFSPLLLLFFATAASAQSPSAPAAPGGVSVVKFSWYGTIYRQGWDSSANSADNETMEDPRSSPMQDPGVSRLPRPSGAPVNIGRNRERAVQSRDPLSGAEQSTSGGPSSPRQRVEEYTYQVQIKNEGAATIEAVEWEYLFLDAGTGGELARHRFQTFRRARPGKSLTLSATSNAPPARVVNASARDAGRKPFDERVVVRCVAYSDGTLRWREGGSARDCDEMRKASQARRQ